jgi:hypothetical protein
MAGARYGNGANTRRRILDVAAELFTERGHDKTPLSSSRHCRDLSAPARPDRHRSLHEHPSDRLVRDAQVLSHVVQRPTLSVQGDL